CAGVLALALPGERLRGRLLRALAALALGGLAAALALQPPAAAMRREVLEGEEGRARWVRAAAGTEALLLRAAAPGLRVETLREDAALTYRVDLTAGTWRADAAGGLVHFRAELPLPPAELDLAPAWWRDPAGRWTRYDEVAGGWGSAAPGEAPPGWLRAGLPPGKAVLLGRLGGGSGAAGGAQGVAWARLLGAPEPQRLPD
ncbi:MAG: hypothetical protein AAF682_18755, partial [Planctomycetota bacterium]